MQFSEFEMTTMTHGVAKTQVALSARTEDALSHQPVTVEESAVAWEALNKFQRYQVISMFSEFLLPVLPALPEVSVEPGQRATYETEQVIEAARESVATDIALDRVAASQADNLTVQRASMTTLALGFLPLKAAEDARVMPSRPFPTRWKVSSDAPCERPRTPTPSPCHAQVGAPVCVLLLEDTDRHGS